MALRLRTNGAPLSGALFVSNPVRRKTSRKAARKVARKRNVAARKSVPKRRKNRRNASASGATKTRRLAALRALRNRRNGRIGTRTNRRNFSVVANRRKRVTKSRRRTGLRKRRTTRRNARVTAARPNRRNRVVRNRSMTRNRSVRRNTNAMVAFGNKLSTPLQRIVGKVPVLGSIAKQFVAPLVIGAAAGAVHYYGVMSLQRFAPAVAERIRPVQFTVTGSLVAGILLAGGKIPGLKKVSAQTRQQIAAAALILGGGLDTYRFLSAKMGDLGAEVPLYDYSGLGMDLGAEVPLYDYGDGGAFDVVGLGALAMNGQPVSYEAAEFLDAAAAPADLSVEEGEAALAGAGYYASTFGECPVTRSRRGDGMSTLAGRPGHRFGWLIKLIGFDRFQKVAALPPQERVALIGQMKQHAINLADQKKVEEEAGSLSGLGMDLSGLGMDLGATLYAGSSF